MYMGARFARAKEQKLRRRNMSAVPFKLFGELFDPAPVVIGRMFALGGSGFFFGRHGVKWVDAFFDEFLVGRGVAA